MASRSVTPVARIDRLGWEWAPPPLPEPSPQRQLEPKWQEPLMVPRGANRLAPAILCLAGGALFLIFAASSAGWIFFSLPLLAMGGIWLHQWAHDSTRPENVAKVRDADWQRYQVAHHAWSSAVAYDEAAEQRRFEAGKRWYPIAPISPGRRIDVFGGSPDGWASFMHTALFPLLSRGVPVTVLDLTQRFLAPRALSPGLTPAQMPLSVALPSGLHRYDPLLGARHPGDIAAFLTSSDGSNDDLARRDIEMGLFRRTADVLGSNVTVPRILAAVTSLLAPDSPLVVGQLTVEERRRLQEPTFLVMLGEAAAGHLGRIAAALEAVVRRSEPVDTDTSTTLQALPFFADGSTVVAAEPVSDPDSRRRFDNMLAASLLDQLATAGASGRPVVVVGADRLARAVIEGLVSGAQEHELLLLMFFEHLRGEARELLGRGAADTILMRLGHHEDATAAANVIGKEHRFVVSSISLTVGTQFGGSDSIGYSITDSESTTDGRSTSRTNEGLLRLFADSATKGESTSKTTGRSTASTFSYQRTWSETENYGETSTRSEEFVARVEDIQRIPTTGFVYVSAVGGHQHVIFGDCHPAIARTPLVAAQPIARG